MSTKFNGSVLVVSDPNQGPLAYSIVQSYFPQSAFVNWERGTSKTYAREAIRRGPGGKVDRWDLVLSFNNDLIFEQEDLDAMGILPLNIHPSLVRGMGYGTWPIIMRHEEYGVLLHYITLDVDNGPIIERLARPLPSDCDYTGLRLRSQFLCLALLDKVCRIIADFEDAESADVYLREVINERALSWGKDYVSIATRDAKLAELRDSDPEHLVFRGMPAPGESPANVAKVPDDLTDVDGALEEVLSDARFVENLS